MSFDERFLTPTRRAQLENLKQSTDETVRNKAAVVEKSIAAGDLSTADRSQARRSPAKDIGFCASARISAWVSSDTPERTTRTTRNRPVGDGVYRAPPKSSLRDLPRGK